MGSKKSNNKHHYPRSHKQKGFIEQILSVILIILVVMVVLAFIGVQPLSAYKDNIVNRLSSLIHSATIPSQINTSSNASAIDEAGITETINEYYSAYNSQAFDKCLNYLSSSVINKYGENGIVQSTSTRYAFGGSVDCQIKKVSVTGNTATISIYEKFSKTFMATSADIVDGTLVKENGQWKLNWEVPGLQ
ncbi:MAG: hypothetical protein ABSG90_07925 [Dehalococcoidia bacterium]|jgi:hypothetical protein